ncbi:T9SS type A sorting domain-containing protein [Cloacibacterium sp.]|uniref:T9SS type A sorting domain-containing protein n=1 Tax=Cloacibacterium sp. TaxID=1913682 RepID=UPI0039E5706E
MKQIVISLAVLLSISIKSQNLYTAWETTFDTPAEIAGWQFYDGNNNNNTWNVGKHVVRQAATPSMYEEVSPDGVLRYSVYIPNVVGSPANFKPDYGNDVEDWAISPEIDLSGYGGEITLAAMIGRLIAYNSTSTSNNTNRSVFVYVSTPAKPVPDVSDFQALRSAIVADVAVNGLSSSLIPKELKITNADYIAEGNALFAQATADLSQYAGKKIYLGFWTNRNFANGFPAGFNTTPFSSNAYPNASLTFQIDEMQVFATEENLSTADAKGKSANVTIYPNPVAEVLYLKQVTKANVAVYNAVGQKVLSKAVTNGQLNVSALQKGVYTLAVETNGKLSTTKFIKK